MALLFAFYVCIPPCAAWAKSDSENVVAAAEESAPASHSSEAAGSSGKSAAPNSADSSVAVSTDSADAASSESGTGKTNPEAGSSASANDGRSDDSAKVDAAGDSAEPGRTGPETSPAESSASTDEKVEASEEEQPDGRESQQSGSSVSEDGTDAATDESGDTEAASAESGQSGNARQGSEVRGDDGDDTAGERDSASESEGQGKRDENVSAEEDSDNDSKKEEGNGSEKSDLAQLWKGKGAKLDREGTYVLDSDLTVDHALVVALGKGKKAEIDLAGHNVTVEGDDVTCAIDLARNEGSLSIVDSSYKAVHAHDGADDKWAPAPMAGITLKATDPKSAPVALDALLSKKILDSRPSLTLQDVFVRVELDIRKAEAYPLDASALRTGMADADNREQAEAVTLPVSLENVSLSVRRLNNVPDEELAAASLSDEQVGEDIAIDAGVKGVAIEGFFATVKAKGSETNVSAVLSSEYGNAYLFDPDSTLPATVTFGFPRSAENASAAVAASSEADKPLEAHVVDALATEEGISLELDESSTKIILTRNAVAEDGLQAGQGADGEAGQTESPREADESEDVGTGLDRTSENAESEERSADADPDDVGASSASPDEQEVQETLERVTALESQAQRDAAKAAVSDFRMNRALQSAPKLTVALSTQADPATQEVDLNADWKASENGLRDLYTISKAGTYYLSADLTGENAIVVDAPDADVTIKFNGHTLKAVGTGGASEKTMVQVNAAASVTFDGTSAAGASTLASGNDDTWLVASAAEDCAIVMRNLSMKLLSTSTAKHDLGTNCLRLSAGSAELHNCTVTMDFCNQIFRNTLLAKADTVPSAIYATARVSSLVLDNCTVNAVGTPAIPLEDVTDLRALGNVYAVYSRADSTIVTGGSYTATSAQGNATCLYGKSLTIASGTTKLVANASSIAAGVLSTVERGVRLSGSIQFATSSEFQGAASVETVLKSTVENGFSFGATGAPSAGAYTALVMPGVLAGANDSNMRIGAFDNMTVQQRQAWARGVTNALVPYGACAVTQDSSGLYFYLASNHAVARVGSTGYATLASALASLGDGETLTLLKDVGAIGVDSVANATIDLNGHSIESLSYSTLASGSAGLRVVNGTIAGTQPIATGPASVLYASPNPLALENVHIVARMTDNNVSGIYASSAASGRLSLRGTSVDVSATRSLMSMNAYGVQVDRSSKAVVNVEEQSSVRVSTASAGVSLCGIYSPSAANLADSTVKVSGTTETTGGIRASGAVIARNITVDVSTAGAASSAYGIWCGTSSGAGDVLVDGCKMSVRSDVDVAQGDYLCLRDDSAGQSSSTAWTLAGACSFTSSSGRHIGAEFPLVSLESTFSLAGGSDSPLSIDQARRDGDVGFEGVSGADISSVASLFQAAPGSAYDGWFLRAQAGNPSHLTWGTSADGVSGSVAIVRGGAQADTFSSVSDALQQAKSGDTIQLLSDLSEACALTVGQDDLVIDLNGHHYTVRSGASAVAPDGVKGGAVSYTGHGKLSISSSQGEGRLTMLVGAATEPVAGAVYQGLSVSGGGAFDLGKDVVLGLEYAGSTAFEAQRDVTVRAVSVVSGSAVLNGKIEVEATRASSTVGARYAYGAFAQAQEGATARIVQTKTSAVSVENSTQARRTESTYYPESVSGMQTPEALRQIHVDARVDADFHAAIQNLFKDMASYDDPTDYSERDESGVGIYYANAMVLDAPGKWYDKLKVWAYSDVVPKAEVGKLDSVVASHIFIATHYDELPACYGIATGASAQGTSTVDVAGAVKAECLDGDAHALDAQGNSSTSWNCAAVALSSRAGQSVHAVNRGDFDLHSFLSGLANGQSAVSYRGIAGTKLVEFSSPVARGVRVANGVSFTLGGSTVFSDSGLDVADIEASRFTVKGDFKSTSSPCTVANASGANASGATFANASGGAPDASQFADAYCELKSTAASGGFLAWGAGSGMFPITFMVGEAVVKRIAGPSSINLADVSKLAVRGSDARQSYELTGWSLSDDENAPAQYGKSSTISPASAAVYHATYGTGYASGINVGFANVRNADGSVASCKSLEARYGQTLGDALSTAGAVLPDPRDYVDAETGIAYRFVGWHPYTSSVPASAQIYAHDSIKASLAFTLAVNGVRDGQVTLWATYVAVQPGEHLVSFKVDGRVSAYAAAEGERPSYCAANGSDNSYTTPAKVTTVTGVSYPFDGWSDETTGKVYGGILPLVTGDVTYVAQFSETATGVTLTFYYLQPDNNDSGSYSRKSRKVTTSYAVSVQSVADSVSKIGDITAFGGKLYELVGWAVRKSDVEALYDANNPIPSGNWDDRIMATMTYSRTYYGIYEERDHYVDVSFHNDGALLGTARVLARVTLDSAFKSTGAALPEDRSISETFLGWNTSASATSALDSTSKTVESLVEPTDSKLDLYAVYGKAPTYTVRFHAEGSTVVLYEVKVARGKSVADVLAKNDASIDAPARVGRYFTGWRTASGELFPLDAKVMGSADLYASYGELKAVTQDADDIDASVACTLDGLEDAKGVEFRLFPTEKTDKSLGNRISKAGFAVLKSYGMQLVVIQSDGQERIVSGDFGTATIKIAVDKGEAKSTLRTFWIADDSGKEKISNSAEKKRDKDGWISFTIGNYASGDVEEGGNLALAKKDSSTAAASVDLDKTSAEADGLKFVGLTPAGVSLVGANLSIETPHALVEVNAEAAKATVNADVKAAAATTGITGEGGSGGDGEGGGGDEGGIFGAIGSMFEGWDSNAVALVALVVVMAAILVRGLWWLLVGRRRFNDDEEPEAAVLSMEHAEGIRF